MKLSARLLIFLIICTLLTKCVQAEDANDLNTGQDSAVTIELTKFDVNDTTLELAWKIVNNTDHDVWICNKIVHGDSYDRFLDPDNETLIIRKRFDLPPGQGWEHLPRAYYVHLRSGQEVVDSISLSVPIEPYTWFNPLRGNAEYAGRVALEIGFYDEDLPGLILEISDLAETLGCDTGLNSPIWDFNDMDVRRRFFGGVFVARFFNLEGFEYFRNPVISGDDEVFIPYMWQTLNGEQVLQLDIDGVYIPIKRINPPLENQDVNEPADSQDVEQSAISMELTHFEITDANLELGWKIINNTDHDVWICDSVSTHSKSERYLAEDAQTLVIRKRLDISPELAWGAAPLGRYVRLQPAQEYSESLSCALPVRPALTYIGERANAESAKRLVLEIGFYDQDLPGLIRSIIEVVEKLGCANVEYEDDRSDIMRHYFKGLLIKNRFGGLEHFDEFHPGGSEQFITTYTDQLLGEQILQLEIDNVSIPYESDYPPLASE